MGFMPFQLEGCSAGLGLRILYLMFFVWLKRYASLLPARLPGVLLWRARSASALILCLFWCWILQWSDATVYRVFARQCGTRFM